MRELQPLDPAVIISHQDGELIRLWLSLKTSPHTRRAYRFDSSHFLSTVRKPLAAVTLSDLQAWVETLGQGSVGTATQNRAITAVKSLLTFGHETGYLPFNVGAAIKLRPHPNHLAQRVLSEEQIAKLVEAAPIGRDRILLRLLYVSGVRVSELCGLRWLDLEARHEGGQITVFGKGGKTRSVLLKANLWHELLSLKQTARPEDPVFASRKRGPLDASQVRRIAYAAARHAGIDAKVSPHWLRHAHASHALDHHAPIHLVQATLGHASVATTGRYLHARPTDSSSFYLPD